MTSTKASKKTLKAFRNEIVECYFSALVLIDACERKVLSQYEAKVTEAQVKKIQIAKRKLHEATKTLYEGRADRGWGNATESALHDFDRAIESIKESELRVARLRTGLLAMLRVQEQIGSKEPA